MRAPTEWSRPRCNALLDRLADAAEEVADAIDAYFDPENQYTESRQRAVLRSKKALRDALDAVTTGRLDATSTAVQSDDPRSPGA